MRFNHSFTRTLALLALLVTATFLIAPAQPAEAQTPAEASAIDAPVGSAFTYQGRLTDNGNAASARYDFQFILYDAATGGNQQGETVTRPNVTVSNGLFTVQLDFGQTVFTGEARFLEVGVKPAGSSGAYTVLSPRTALTPVPYALGMPGVVTQGGVITVDGQLYMTGEDFVMLPTARGDGGRALVHWVNDTLVVNLAGDFAGGTTVDSNLWVSGNLSMAGEDFVMLPTARGDGGRAFVHWVNDSLVINFANDFTGGTIVDSTLAVNGDVHANNFIVNGTTLNVPDYVFEADYPLMSLDELAAYIATEKHLPGVPSASDIARDGLNVSEFHMRLLEKVEELTLYTLAQQEQIEAMEARLAALEE